MTKTVNSWYLRSAKAFCESRNMGLWTPDLPTIYTNMKSLNSSIFWTGFERLNLTFFNEKSTSTKSNCLSNSWSSEANQGWRFWYTDRQKSFFFMFLIIDFPQTMLKYPSTPFCNSWEWGGKLVAIVIGDRLVAYQVVTDFALSSADCLCYKYFPSIADIISNHRKVVEYSLFGFLRKVLSIKIYILFS